MERSQEPPPDADTADSEGAVCGLSHSQSRLGQVTVPMNLLLPVLVPAGRWVLCADK